MATKSKRRPKTAQPEGTPSKDTGRRGTAPAPEENEGTEAEHEPEVELEHLEPDLGDLPEVAEVAEVAEVDLDGDLPLAAADGEGADEGDPAGPRTLALAPVAPGGRALTTFDPLTQYVNEIRRYPLLTREEEHELAVRFVKTGDVEAARRLITSNLRLVVKIAHEYRRAYRNLLDLVQEGNLGLLQAVNKYDPYRGVKLSSYAAWWIRAYILKFILNNWRLVKIGTTQAQRKLFFNLRKEKEALEREGFAPEAKLLAERLSVTEQEVTDMEKRMGSGEQSLDAPVGPEEDGRRSHMDLLEASGETRPDVATEADEFRALLRSKLEQFASTLRGRELTIFKERVHSDAPLTLQEIGDRYGISRERARQLEKRLTAKLRDFLEDELGDAVEIAMGIED
ncbi:MAG TPA: RNA polymerase factor sigma-32 [Polyangia bacterium]|jgi:RNA polymerase sigma-32 factor|nr:RNA polymerase factor sigma-32 [Polyangia bacterium]